MIELSKTDGVAVLTMNRPAQRNAMSAGLVQALIEAFSQLNGDAEVRAIVLAGAGSGFCADSDIRGLVGMSPAERQNFEAESGRLARLLGTLAPPVIAAVGGFAIGGGMTLATSCDLIVSERSAKWSLPEVPIGLFPAWGLASVVHRVGRVVAKRLAYGVDVLSGEEAYRLGLVDYIVEQNAGERALELARELAKLPAQQGKFVKEYFATNATVGDEAADFAANNLFMRSTVTEEAQASFKKFSAKG